MTIVRGSMQSLVLAFPSLRSANHRGLIPNTVLDPFDAITFDQCSGSWLTAGSEESMRFVLSVWCGGSFELTDEGHPTKARWKVGAFDLHRALGRWDDAHRAAFFEWVRDPWWP